MNLLLWASLASGTLPGQDQETKPIPLPQAAWQCTADPSDPSLVQIDEFRIRLGAQAVALQLKEPESLAAVVNPFTFRKRGRMYGSLYEYHRNDNLDARNFFDPVGEPLPEFKRNQFGGSFGIFLSDRLTLFGTYDGLRINRGSTILSHVPTPEMKRGDFSALGASLTDPLTGAPFPGNRIPAQRIHPVAAKMLSTIPDPNRSDPVRNYVNNQPRVDNTNTFTSRIDYQFNNSSKLFANFSLRNGNRVEVEPLPVFGASSRERRLSISVDYTRDFSPNLIGNLGLRYQRNTELQLSAQSGQTGLLASLGIAGLQVLDDTEEGYPGFDISGYAGLGGDSDWPNTSFQNNYEIGLDLNYIRQSHSLQFGGDIETSQINNHRTGGLRRGSFQFDGYYTGDAFGDFLLGMPNVANRGVGSDRSDLRRRTWRVYARDNWKISPRLSVSLSLTYNYFPFYRSINGNVSTFAPLLFEPPLDGEIVVTGSDEAVRLGLTGLTSGHAVYPDRNDWEPGVGIAFSPLGDNSMVIRASYQIDYDSIGERQALDYLGRNYPFYYTERSESSESEPGLDLGNPFASAAPTELNIRAIDPHLRNSYTQEWELSVENEPFRNWNLEVSYRGNKSTRSDRSLPANVPLPGPGTLQDRRPNPDFGRFTILSGGGASSSNSLSVNLEKRLSHGLSLKSSYSFSRTFSDDGGSNPSNPRNLRAERAPGSNQRFSLTYIYDLPLGRNEAVPLEWMGGLRPLIEGWRVSGITSFQNGRLFTPRLAGDPNNDGVRGDRPDRIGPGTLDPSDRSIDQWFATGDFVFPADAYGFGDSGRNILRAPGSRTWDVSLIKRTRITESGNMLEFRVQFFNAFNHTNFSQPNATVGTSLFGSIFGAGRSREIEIALKYSF